MSSIQKLRVGDWVEVRSKGEILKTLDQHGYLEALPFMPEMLQYCGQRFQVSKRAHKTCDPPSGLRARRMTDSVHLTGVRCGGEAHGGCQAGCLIFWKQAWLRKLDVDDSATQEPGSPAITDNREVTACMEENVLAGVYQAGESTGPDGPAYVCQSTRLYAATTPLLWWDPRQYVEDLRSGNVRLSQMVSAFVFFLYHTLMGSGVGLGGVMLWAYDAFQEIRGGTPYPWRGGKIPTGMRTPSEKLDLKAGEVVRVRSYAEILETLNQDCKNRGVYFDGEQVPFCNGTYRVLRRVEKIIDEKTGNMIHLKNDAIILDGVVCQARYAKCRHFCSRSIYPYWREIWLRRVG